MSEVKKKTHRWNLRKMLPKAFLVFSTLNRDEDEKNLLIPDLEKLGYKNIVFIDGPDGSRIAKMTGRYGQSVEGIY